VWGGGRGGEGEAGLSPPVSEPPCVSATMRRCFRLVPPRVRQDLYFAVRKVRPSVRAYTAESARALSVCPLPSRSPCRGVKDSYVPPVSVLPLCNARRALPASCNLYWPTTFVAGWTDRSRAIRPRDQVRTFNRIRTTDRMKGCGSSLFPDWRTRRTQSPCAIAEIRGRRDYYWVYKLISCFLAVKSPIFYRPKIFSVSPNSSVQSDAASLFSCLN